MRSTMTVFTTSYSFLFKYSGNYYPSLSDHALIYGVLKERVNPNKPKVIIFRSLKNFEPDRIQTTPVDALGNCLMKLMIRRTPGIY